MDVDAALLKIGTFNRWRAVVYSMLCTSVTFSGCWHMMSIVFTGGEPKHYCRLSENETINETIPLVLGKNKRWHHSQCLRYVNRSLSNDTMPCPNGWTYDRTEFQETIVTEWDLVCDRNYLVETSQSVFSFGVMVGAVVFTTLADRVGRKPVHICCQYVLLVISLAIVYSGNYATFVVLRFFQGAVREGTGLVGIVMACELFPAVHRTFAGTVLELFWATAWMVMALIAHFVRHWRYFQLAITLPPIWTLSLIWLLPESIPWLVANNRIESAEAILRKAAKHGGVQLPDRPLKDHAPPTQPQYVASSQSDRDGRTEREREKEEGDRPIEGDAFVCNHSSSKSAAKNSIEAQTKKKKRGILCWRQNSGPNATQKSDAVRIAEGKADYKTKTKLTCLDIMKSPHMVLYASVMCCLWFASGIVYYGLSLSTSTLAGDKYVNFFLSGAVEAPAYAMTVFVLKRFGRRWPLFVFHLTAAAVLFGNIFIPQETADGVDLTALIITLTMIGKFSMTAAFGTVVLYAPEIYPTNLRNFGLGLASVWGRLGAMIAPFFGYISKTNDWISSVVFTAVALVTGLMVLALPETLDRPLPETVEEILAWRNDESKSKPAKREKLIIND